MGSSNPKRRTCRHCGKQMGKGAFAEIRVLDHIPVQVRNGDGWYTRWKTRSEMTHYICAECAARSVSALREMEA